MFGEPLRSLRAPAMPSSTQRPITGSTTKQLSVDELRPCPAVAAVVRAHQVVARQTGQPGFEALVHDVGDAVAVRSDRAPRLAEGARRSGRGTRHVLLAPGLSAV